MNGRIDTHSGYSADPRVVQSHAPPYILRINMFSLYIFYCHKLQQWGWVTSSRNICYDPPPTVNVS